MMNLVKDTTKLTCAGLLFWVAVSAILALVTPLDYSDALFITAITFGVVAYAVYAAKKLNDNRELKRRWYAHKCIINESFPEVATQHWSSKILVPLKPEEIDGGFMEDPQLPFKSALRLRISPTNPLTATDKTILKSAIQTDMNYWVTNQLIPCQRIFVHSLHVDNQFLWVYLEVTLWPS
jgi:hypothetical protein